MKMTKEEAIARIKAHIVVLKMTMIEPKAILISEALDMAIKILEQEPCDDAISRQAVIDGLNSINGTSELDKAFEVIENLPPVNPRPKTGHWIPVNERVPEEDGCYLVTTTGTYNDIIDIAFYTDDIWHKASRIKAWMPLPEPYKLESEE